MRYTSIVLAVLSLAGCGHHLPSANIDPFLNDWYSAQLRAAREPILSPTKSEERQIVRFTWIPSFDPTVTVRLIRDGSNVTLVAKRLTGKGGYSPGHVGSSKTIQLSQDQWVRVQTLLDESEFWSSPCEEPRTTPTGEELMQVDGDEWLLEAADFSRYHCMNRGLYEYYPQFEELCFCLLAWSDIAPETDLEGYMDVRRLKGLCSSGS